MSKWKRYLTGGCLVYALVVTILFFKSPILFAGAAVIPFVGVLGYVSLKSVRLLFSLMVLSLPLSINVSDVGGGLGISLPGEPIVVFLMVIGLVYVINNFKKFIPILTHWMSFVILLHLIWMGVTTFTSEMPIVSFKFLIIRSIYVVVFYLLAVDYFSQFKNVQRFFWIYMGAFSVPILFSFYNHSHYNFSQAYSYALGLPFYNDHTIYAACIAMLIPIFIGIAVHYKSREGANRNMYIISVLAVFLLVSAIIFSYSRAGWLSLIVAAGCLVAMLFRIRFNTALILVIGILTVVYLNQEVLLEKLRENDTQSSEGLLNHAQSVSNISTDNSNIERLNRWVCALRMFEERPMLGFGPGTYQFQYSQFQLSGEMTWVSVRDGSVGGVHSEYLKPLSEMGVVGIILFVIIFGGTLKIGVDYTSVLPAGLDRKLVIGMTLGYITYLVHGIVNFFLDTDKSSVLFWGIVAAMVALDLREKSKRRAGSEELEK